MEKNTTPNTNLQKEDTRVLAVNWNENLIGYLLKEKEGNYLFKYDYKGIQEARKLGYQYLVGFKDIRKVYVSKDLFPVFKSRIPTKQRRNLSEIMEKLGMKTYDEFDLLSLSGGRLFTDAISFSEYNLEVSKLKNKRISRMKPRVDRGNDSKSERNEGYGR